MQEEPLISESKRSLIKGIIKSKLLLIQNLLKKSKRKKNNNLL